MSIQKRDILFKLKERDDCNHRNTLLQYFEDYNLSVTQRLGKRTVYGWALDSHSRVKSARYGVPKSTLFVVAVTDNIALSHSSP